MRQTLLEEPARFSFDAAVAAMMRASGRSDPGEAIRFRAPSGLAFVASDISSVEPLGDCFIATTGLLGLTGPGGVLPRLYSEIANNEQRHRSTALAAFLDVLAQRPLAHFASAGIKYRPHRAADAASLGAGSGECRQDGIRHGLLALTGHALPGLAERLAFGTDPLLFHAGAFAARPRSADRLAAILSDWLEQTVEVEQFAGSWLDLGADQMTALPSAGHAGRFNRLGVDTAIGARAWDIQSQVMLIIGPLGLDDFTALLPGQERLDRLVALARAYLEGEIGLKVNAVLAADAVPPLRLGAPASPKLGWNTWLPTSAPRRHDARDAVFDPAPERRP